MNVANTQAQPSTTASAAVIQVRDFIRGAAAVGAVQSGWPEDKAIVLAHKAEHSAVSRIASGMEPQAALKAAMSEADLIIAMDLFSTTLSKTGDVNAAFNAVAAVKAKVAEKTPGGEQIMTAARAEFTQSISRGMSPYAALASAFTTASNVAQLVQQKKS